MKNNLLEMLKELYPESDADSIEFNNNELRISLNGEVRFYRFEGDNLYVYKPELIKGDGNIRKFKSMFREAKISKIVK